MQYDPEWESLWSMMIDYYINNENGFKTIHYWECIAHIESPDPINQTYREIFKSFIS